MISLGVNSVLFVGHDLETAMRHIAWAGYDGVELSAIKGMCEHLELDRWREQAGGIRDLAAKYNLKLLSMEEAALDEQRLTLCQVTDHFKKCTARADDHACAELGDGDMAVAQLVAGLVAGA